MSVDMLVGILGVGATYRGHLSFEGRVRIDGEFIGSIRSESLVEVGPTGRVQGDLEVGQALIAGTVIGTLFARERATLLETAMVRGKLVTPWLDVRVGCQLDAEILVDREEEDNGTQETGEAEVTEARG